MTSILFYFDYTHNSRFRCSHSLSQRCVIFAFQ